MALVAEDAVRCWRSLLRLWRLSRL
jgi:hypothetical protein